MLFRRVVLYALLVGAASGLLLTAVQLWQVIPIIKTAELFETELASASADAHGGHEHGHAGHDHAHAPAAGVQRTGNTLVANVLIAAGMALILLPAMVASLRTNAATKLDWRYGVLWGAAGYAVFFLAPALGVPPEIPGAVSAPLEARQLWWVLAVVCTAAGLAGVAFGKSPWRWAALGLLAVPHLVGAPEAPAMFAQHPPSTAAELESLARQFIGATALANAVLWLALGLASVFGVRRIVSASMSSTEE